MIVKAHFIFKEVKDRNMISDPQHPSLYSTVSAISTAADGLTVQRWKYMTVALSYVCGLCDKVKDCIKNSLSYYTKTHNLAVVKCIEVHRDTQHEKKKGKK